MTIEKDREHGAGVGIRCTGSELRLANCSIYNAVEYPCSGGATILTCKSSLSGNTEMISEALSYCLYLYYGCVLSL